MRCEEVSARIADQLAGTLGEAERAALRQHVEGCADCRRQTEGLELLWQALERIPAPAPDSRALARTQWLMAASVAGVALLAGLLIGRANAPAPASPDVVALREELRDLRHMVALSLMQQQSASERLKGVGWSTRLEGPSEEVVTALIDTLRHDATVNVRLASIDALKRFAERDDVRRAALDVLQTQRVPLVQMALIDFVVETQDREAVTALRRISDDAQQDQTVRTRAAWGLEHLGV